MDVDVLGEHLDLLQQIVPTNEEIQYVRDQMEETDSDFDEAGQFFSQFLRFRDLPDRVRLWTFSKRFQSLVETIDENINTLSKACSELCQEENNRFVQFLSLVLTLGNYLNSKPMNAAPPKMHYGYQLSSLNKLNDTRATDKSNVTLLQFLIKWLCKEHSQVSLFYEDLVSIAPASHISVAAINNEIMKCKKQLGEIRQLIEKVAKHASERIATATEEEDLFDSKFLHLMRSFSSKATSRMIEIDRKWEEMRDQMRQVASLFCEKETDILREAQGFFTMLDRFIETYKSVLKKHQENKGRKRINK
jgi:hypothetical protein